jgi:hypothetical protein
MDELPDLARLSVAEKDDLIRELWPLRALVRQLSEQVTALTAKVAELEGRLAKNSRNSSKPPSSDGLNRPKPKSQRKAGQKPNGGQKGHPGHTLTKVAEVDHIETHAPQERCDACGARLTNAVVVEARQVFDLPPLSHEITELNLIDRLRDYADDVWRFATDHHVPFSNNVAEQAVRMPKVKQKISGSFRTTAGLETFCTTLMATQTPPPLATSKSPTLTST